MGGVSRSGSLGDGWVVWVAVGIGGCGGVWVTRRGADGRRPDGLGWCGRESGHSGLVVGCSGGVCG